jgi:hypothetical protein
VNEISPNVEDERTSYARIDDEENDTEEVTNELEDVQENSSRSTELEEGIDAEDIEQRPTEMLGMVEVTMKNRSNLINEVGLKTFHILAFLLSYFLAFIKCMTHHIFMCETESCVCE